jgi:hypothetical protein
MDDIRDHTVEQDWAGYSADEHAVWRLLFERQQRLLVGRACGEYLDGLRGLGVAAGGIPDFSRLSDLLDQAKLEGLLVEITGLENSSSTLRAIAASFKTLKEFADFEAEIKEDEDAEDEDDTEADEEDGTDLGFKMGLSYTINLVLPKTDDIAVFNAIFKSLRENLLKK